MTSSRACLLGLLALAVSGCLATEPGQWRAGMPDRFLLDREECQARADDASFRMTAMGGAILPLVGLVQRSTTFSECMSARGYTRR